MPEWFGGAVLGSSLGLSPSDQWKAQWNRVQRWRRKVQRIREKAVRTELDAFDLDDVIAYVQNCYHLRDWLEVSRPALKVSLTTSSKSTLNSVPVGTSVTASNIKRSSGRRKTPTLTCTESTTIFLERPWQNGVQWCIVWPSPTETICESSICLSSRTPASRCGQSSLRRKSVRCRRHDVSFVL